MSGDDLRSKSKSSGGGSGDIDTIDIQGKGNYMSCRTLGPCRLQLIHRTQRRPNVTNSRPRLSRTFLSVVR